MLLFLPGVFSLGSWIGKHGSGTWKAWLIGLGEGGFATHFRLFFVGPRNGEHDRGTRKCCGRIAGPAEGGMDCVFDWPGGRGFAAGFRRFFVEPGNGEHESETREWNTILEHKSAAGG